eukprot:1837331-Rhodomonas_salina.1
MLLLPPECCGRRPDPGDWSLSPALVRPSSPPPLPLALSPSFTSLFSPPCLPPPTYQPLRAVLSPREEQGGGDRGPPEAASAARGRPAAAGHREAGAPGVRAPGPLESDAEPHFQVSSDADRPALTRKKPRLCRACAAR